MIRNQKVSPKICGDDFNGRLIVITGATSRIGYATAKNYPPWREIWVRSSLVEKQDNDALAAVPGGRDREAHGVRPFGVLLEYDAMSMIIYDICVHPKNIDVMIHNAGFFVT